MTETGIRTWQAAREEVLRRIRAREWRPGDMIPNEADLAEEFGCARATVNRALRSLSEDGLLDRRRKAGTRVAQRPVARATISIPILRQEIEDRGHAYDYWLIHRRLTPAPDEVLERLKLPGTEPLLHVVSLHLADNAPFAREDRWINPAAVPEALDQAFDAISANEWLVQHRPFTGGEIAFEAIGASPETAEALAIAEGTPIFRLARATWEDDQPITSVRICFAPGYRMTSAF